MNIGECKQVYERYSVNSHEHTGTTTNLCKVIVELEAQVAELIADEEYTGDWSGEIVNVDCVLLRNKRGADNGVLITMDAYEDLLKFCRQRVDNQSKGG